MSGLSTRAMLVSLHMSVWSARKLDKQETEDVAIKHNTDRNVARVNKSLLPGSKNLEAITKLAGTIRTEFYRRSLPWAHGSQIIKSTGFLEFSDVMGNYKRQFYDYRDTFVSGYLQDVSAATSRMNGLFDINDYPDADQVRDKFSMRLSFMPVPDAMDWRVDVGDEFLAELRDSTMREAENKASEAMQDAWRRVYDVVSKAHERLSSADNIFRDSMVENAIDLCRLLPDLNITDDPNLEAMRRELEGSLCATTPDTLRNSVHVREQVADKMADIMAKMGAFYGN